MKERVMAITKDYAIHISLGALLAFGGAVWWMSATYATIRINEKKYNGDQKHCCHRIKVNKYQIVTD